MRKTHESQPSLAPRWIDHPHAKELEKISELLDSTPRIADLATADLVGKDVSRHHGAPGMTGEQVVRAAIIKQMNGYSYEHLAFHLVDSASYRAFCRIGLGEDAPKRATLADNIARLSPDTWAEIHRCVVELAVKLGVEDGERVRVDGTAVDANIRRPADSELLDDTVRVLTRWLHRARKAGCVITFQDRTLYASRRATSIRWMRSREARIPPYGQLIDAAARTVESARDALGRIRAKASRAVQKIASKLRHFIGLGAKVVDQARRRILGGESVPAAEKIVSIFEEHADIIAKDRRDTQYGHKVTFVVGRRGVVLDTVVEDGNPGDVTLVERSVERARDALGATPKQVAFDGSYASRANVAAVKALGVEEVCFSKRRGMDTSEMTSSPKVYRELWRFRAGVEGWISLLKRRFGLDRCSWRGEDAFKAYVIASVVACNLLTIARHQLAA